MSRVFDALHEAARLRGANGAPVEAVWKELGVTPSAAPLEAQVPAPEVIAAAPEVPQVRVAAPESVSVATPAVLPDAPPAKLILDKAARLIPHTADPVVVERYRMLRTKILQERERKFFRSLVITSASPQEGKTVTVLNLALSFAALPSFKVLVVDGDMRRGTLGTWLGIDPKRPGLSNLIDGSASVEQAVLKSDDLSLHVLPRGSADVADLQPHEFSTYFRPLVEAYDLVLVDSPPVNLITDVQILAASCDAILMIARAFSTTRKSIEEAVDKLESFRLIGTVLNAGTAQRSHKYNGYY
jgi:capsular exopolysaccharide synthesis family protein